MFIPPESKKASATFASAQMATAAGLSWLLSGAAKTRVFIAWLWSVMPKGYELPGVLAALLLLSVALRAKYSIFVQDKHHALVQAAGVQWVASWLLFIALPVTPWLVDLAITIGLLALNLRSAWSAVDGFGFSLSGAQFWSCVIAQLACVALSVFYNAL